MISTTLPLRRARQKQMRSRWRKRNRGHRMGKDYVTQVNGAYRIADSRVSLDSVVYAWLQGHSPEAIADSFPVLTLEEVYGAITFYLSNRAAIDEYLRKGKAAF